MKKYIILSLVFIYSLMINGANHVNANDELVFFEEPSYETKINQLEELYNKAGDIISSMSVQDLLSPNFRIEYENQIFIYRNLQNAINDAKSSTNNYYLAKEGLLNVISKLKSIIQANNLYKIIIRIDAIIDSMDSEYLDETKKNALFESISFSSAAKANLDSFINGQNIDLYNESINNIQKSINSLRTVKSMSY